VTVFILGAGASIHAGYPSAYALLRAVGEWIESDQTKGEDRIRVAQLRKCFPTLDDCESILAVVEDKTHSADAWESVVAKDHLQFLRCAIRAYFDSIRRVSRPDLYEQLASRASPGDVVITFNYDLEIERALRTRQLWTIRDGYGFTIENGPKTPVTVLKLHGSTNWFNLLFGGCTVGPSCADDSLGSRPIMPWRGDMEFLGEAGFIDPMAPAMPPPAALVGGYPALIAPLREKSFGVATGFGFEHGAFWDALWSRAKEALERAANIVLIGYSLPVADRRACELVFSHTNKRSTFSVYCREDTAAIRARLVAEGIMIASNTGEPGFIDYLAV